MLYFIETIRDSYKYSHTKYFIIEWFKIASNIKKNRKEKERKTKGPGIAKKFWYYSTSIWWTAMQLL